MALGRKFYAISPSLILLFCSIFLIQAARGCQYPEQLRGKNELQSCCILDRDVIGLQIIKLTRNSSKDIEDLKYIEEFILRI